MEGIRVWDGLGGTGFMPALLGMVFALLGLGVLIPRPPGRASVSISWPLKEVWQKIGLIFLFLVPVSVPFVIPITSMTKKGASVGPPMSTTITLRFSLTAGLLGGYCFYLFWV